jgi:hypothetical protein
MGGFVYSRRCLFRLPQPQHFMKNENRIEPETAIHTQVAAAREGRDPRVIARLFSGWAVFGERQFLRGYALLLPDPVVPSLRINYSILGNVEPALHAHVIPRYLDEPEKLRLAQPWAYDWEAAPAFERTTHQDLAENLRRELTRMGVTKPMRFDPGANAGGVS